jgi:hypothetical protein
MKSANFTMPSSLGFLAARGWLAQRLAGMARKIRRAAGLLLACGLLGERSVIAQ